MEPFCCAGQAEVELLPQMLRRSNDPAASHQGAAEMFDCLLLAVSDAKLSFGAGIFHIRFQAAPLVLLPD